MTMQEYAAIENARARLYWDHTRQDRGRPRGGITEEIMELIRDCPMTAKEIVAELGAKKGTVAGTLSRIVSDGRAVAHKEYGNTRYEAVQ